MDNKEVEKDFYQWARQRDWARKDVQQVRFIKGRSGSVLTGEESVLRRLKKQEVLMSVENSSEEKRWRTVNHDVTDIWRAED